MNQNPRMMRTGRYSSGGPSPRGMGRIAAVALVVAAAVQTLPVHAARERAASPRASDNKPDAIERLRGFVQEGTLFESGLGRPVNLSRAFELYCRAAAEGHVDALVRMAWMFEEGRGVEQSNEAASTLFDRASRFGSAAAAEQARRLPRDRDVLPSCLRGTLAERGIIERPPTAAEVASLAARAESLAPLRSAAASAERLKFVKIVVKEAPRFRLDPRLVLAVMATESGFDQNARSPRNAWGLMQLIPETAERFAVKDISDPVENIRGGMSYLRWLLSYFRGDVTLTLAAYNAGEGAVDKHNGVPPYAETIAYVQRIRAAYPFDRHPYDPRASVNASRSTRIAAQPAGDTAPLMAAGENPLSATR